MLTAAVASGRRHHCYGVQIFAGGGGLGSRSRRRTWA